MHKFLIDFSIRIGTQSRRMKEEVTAIHFSAAKQILQARYPECKITFYTVREIH